MSSFRVRVGVEKGPLWVGTVEKAIYNNFKANIEPRAETNEQSWFKTSNAAAGMAPTALFPLQIIHVGSDLSAFGALQT
jgi:hypothetical protein